MALSLPGVVNLIKSKRNLRPHEWRKIVEMRIVNNK